MLESAEGYDAAVRAEAVRVLQSPVTAEMRARWKTEADALPAESIRYAGPWRVLLDEAYDVARFVIARWHPRRPPLFVEPLPGLSQVRSRVPYTITSDLVELAHLADEAQNLCLLRSGKPEEERPRDVANALLGDLVPALDLLFDDGVDDDNDTQLAQLRATFETPDVSIAQLTEALSAYGALAAQHRDGLQDIEFDVTRLDALPGLVVTLRALPPSGQLPTPEDDELRRLRNHRDRLATLLYRRMGKARKAARYCFRKHPEIAREATSAHQRQRRAKARQDAPNPTPTPKPELPT